MRIPDTVLEEIREKASLQDVVSEYVTLEKKGNRLWGLCPFHTEKTPSFSVDEEKGLYYCYGCKKGGSVFNFLMEMDKMTFIEAVRALAEKTNVSLPAQQDQGTYDAAAKDQRLLYELHGRLKESFHHLLMNHPQGSEAREYLVSREIPEDMMRKFSLGYVPKNRTWLYEFLRKRHYSDDFLEKTGLFSKKHPKISLFSGRLIFPILDRRGRTIAFGGRGLEEGAFAKYVNSPETVIFHKRKTLFGLFESKEGIRESEKVILCEGYFDVMALHQAGFPYAAAPLGTACTSDHAYELKRFAKEVLLMFDQDSAGIDAMVKTLPVLEALDLDSSIVEIPRGRDPADLVREDIELLKKSVKNPINSFIYLVKTLAQRYDVYLPEGKRSIFQHTFPLIASTASEIKRDEYLRTAADMLQLDVSVLYDDFRSMSSSAGRRKVVREKPIDNQNVIQRDVELQILITMFAHGKLYSRFRSGIDKEQLRNPVARKLYLVLEDAFRRGVSQPEIMIEDITDEKLKSFLIQELESGSYLSSPERIAEDGLKQLKLRGLSEQQRSVVSRIKELEQKEDAGSLQKLRELLHEKKYLDEEIQELRKRNYGT